MYGATGRNLAMALARMAERNAHRVFGAAAIRQVIQQSRRIGGTKPSHFDPKINRHTGKPHEHKREIERRQVQEGNRLFREDMRRQADTAA